MRSTFSICFNIGDDVLVKIFKRHSLKFLAILLATTSIFMQSGSCLYATDLLHAETNLQHCNKNYWQGESVYFGEYPQTEIKDVSKDIEEASYKNIVIKKNRYLDSQSQREVVTISCDGDAKVGNDKVRRCIIIHINEINDMYNAEYLEKLAIVLKALNNNQLKLEELRSRYNRNGITVEAKYFKYEPLLWRIINYNNQPYGNNKSNSLNSTRENAPVDNNSMFLVCNAMLDHEPYCCEVYRKKKNIDWNKSDICEWLNYDFMNSAFNNSLIDSVCDTKILNSVSCDKNNDTSKKIAESKIFIPSLDEFDTAMHQEYCLPELFERTDYEMFKCFNNEYSCLTRSPIAIENNESICNVISYESGFSVIERKLNTKYCNAACVPALNIKRSDICFMSAADNSNKNYEPSATLNKFDNTNGVYKFNLNNTDWINGKVNVSQMMIKNNVANISLNFDDSFVDDNNYVSAIIFEDQSESNPSSPSCVNVMYYGKLAAIDGEDVDCRLIIPDDIPSSYTVSVFVEHCNDCCVNDVISMPLGIFTNILPEPSESPQPTTEPTESPEVTTEPSESPEVKPSESPEVKPSESPEPEPSETPQPTIEPTELPEVTTEPTESPEVTSGPSESPELKPSETPEPTLEPLEPSESPIPTTEPTESPVPTLEPLEPSDSPQPTIEPTGSPEVTTEPSESPVPTTEPTELPQPTIEPTESPEVTTEPSESPEVKPSDSPKPTIEPTESPEVTIEPTESPKPTIEPTGSPEVTSGPSESPEIKPSETPQPEPTELPKPTIEPTESPEVTTEPSESPVPTLEPLEPSESPEVTIEPTESPEVTSGPSESPEVTTEPSESTSIRPSIEPTPSDTPSSETPKGKTPLVTSSQENDNNENINFNTKEIDNNSKDESNEYFDLDEIKIPSIIKNRKFVNGYPAGIFMPESSLTRAEAAQMIYNITYNGTLVNYDCLNKFSDVKINDWYSTPIAYLTNRGLIKGHDGMFFPDDKITRAEVAQLLFNVRMSYADENKKLKLGRYAFELNDIAKSSMHDAISHLASNKLLRGYSDNSFKPNQEITRAEITVMIERTFDMNLKNYDDQKFIDVDRNHWAFVFINSAYID
jgi:hypothetical protein